jgi:hypothetical protein
MKQSADWFSWIPQFLFGLFIGHTLGTALALLVLGGDHLPAHASFLAWGVGLIGAGLGSLFGDRLWLSLSKHVIPPDRVTQNGPSRFLSLCAVTLGGLFIIATLLRTFNFFGENS